MKHLFVPYETALKLKEKGFKEDCFKYYHINFSQDGLREYSDIREFENMLNAPTYQQVEDWLRENHNIEIQIDNYHNKTDNWCYRLLNIVLTEDYNLDYESNHDDIYFPTYYQAKEKAIEHILKNYIK